MATDYLQLEPIFDGLYFKECGARGRPILAKLEHTQAIVLELLYNVFGKDVRAHYGGVFWGTNQNAIAYTLGNVMYFNARQTPNRNIYDIFTDICHEYAHIVRKDENKAKTDDWHDKYFTLELEEIVAQNLPSFFKYLQKQHDQSRN